VSGVAGLTGMKEIQKHMNLSEATILAWIRRENFPARKLGGIWISDTVVIERWRIKKIEGVSPTEKRPLPKSGKVVKGNRTRRPE
jgi:hypothetical protein